MLVWYWILLFMYVCLILVYVFTKKPNNKFPSWPVLQNVFEQHFKKLPCSTSADCPSTHVCMNNECILKLLRTEDCNSDWGQWISYDKQGTMFAICTCKNPKLMDQRHFGGDCNVNVGCGAHGTYLLDQNRCECDPGYEAVGLDCVRMPVVNSIVECDPDNEMEVSDIQQSTGFHPDYLKRLSKFKCVKRPCSFDAFSGRPLKHAKFEPDWGCVCDPRYGLFGVTINGKNKEYLNVPGFNACASIFREDPVDPMDVKVITYFYLEKRKPVSVIVFENLNESKLIDPLQHSQNWTIGQELWNYDFAQHFFKAKSKFRARTRAVRYCAFGIETINEWLYVNDFSLIYCHQIPNLWGQSPYRRANAYRLLYENPVCQVHDRDNTADRMFLGKVIVNPLQLTLKDYPLLHRWNSFVLYYERELDRWTLDLGYEYKIDTYRAIDTNAPKYLETIPQLGNRNFGFVL